MPSDAARQYPITDELSSGVQCAHYIPSDGVTPAWWPLRNVSTRMIRSRSPTCPAIRSRDPLEPPRERVSATDKRVAPGRHASASFSAIALQEDRLLDSAGVHDIVPAPDAIITIERACRGAETCTRSSVPPASGDVEVDPLAAHR